MSVAQARGHSRAEVVFGVMKALVAGRMLWGPAGALSVASLRPLVRADASQVAGALRYLRSEGIVHVDRRLGMVHLTDRALRELIG